MYVNFSCVPQFSRVMYGNYSCYYSLYGFVLGTRIVTTEPMVISNPVSVGYTIYDTMYVQVLVYLSSFKLPLNIILSIMSC